MLCNPLWMGDHPLLLRMLDAYVRRPLEDTLVDVYVFTPCKKRYMETCDTFRMLKKYETGKYL